METRTGKNCSIIKITAKFGPFLRNRTRIRSRAQQYRKSLMEIIIYTDRETRPRNSNQTACSNFSIRTKQALRAYRGWFCLVRSSNLCEICLIPQRRASLRRFRSNTSELSMISLICCNLNLGTLRFLTIAATWSTISGNCACLCRMRTWSGFGTSTCLWYTYSRWWCPFWRPRLSGHSMKPITSSFLCSLCCPASATYWLM